MLGENLLGHFTYHRQPGAQAVVALRLVERFQQFALLNANQVARLIFDVPELDVRKRLQSRTVAVLDSARSGGDTAHAPRTSSEKTHQAVGLSQRKGLQDDGFRFPGS